jgi:cytochrome bd-type quinol oxidase subunit 2
LYAPEIFIFYCLKGFALYTFAYLIIKRFNPNQSIELFDNSAKTVTIWVGLVYLVTIITQSIIFLLDTEQANAVNENRMFGPYWKYYLFQFVLIIIATQLLNNKKLANNTIFRIIVSCIFLFNLQTYTLLAVHFPKIPRIIDNLYVMPVNIIFFLSLTWVFHLIKQLKS